MEFTHPPVESNPCARLVTTAQILRSAADLLREVSQIKDHSPLCGACPWVTEQLLVRLESATLTLLSRAQTLELCGPLVVDCIPPDNGDPDVRTRHVLARLMIPTPAWLADGAKKGGI